MISEFKRAWEQRTAIAGEWKEKHGKVLGYFNSLVPVEMIHAAGILPVEILSVDRDTTGSRRFLPEFLCPYLKDCLEQALEGDLNYLDGVAMSHACESLRGFYGVWKKNSGLPNAFFMQVPATSGEGATEFFIDELKVFKEFLEDVAGRKLTDEALEESIRVHNENRLLIRKLYELRAQQGCSLSGSDVLDIVKAGLVMPKERHNAMLSELLTKIQATPPKAAEDGRVRWCILGNDLQETAVVARMAEEVGADTVWDNLSFGLRYCWETVAGVGDPLASLARHYLTKIPCPGKYPMATLANELSESMVHSKADGLIWVIEKFCDPYLFQYPLLLDSLQEKGVRILNIEAQDIKNAGRLKLKMEAFVEMLREDSLF